MLFFVILLEFVFGPTNRVHFCHIVSVDLCEYAAVPFQPYVWDIYRTYRPDKRIPAPRDRAGEFLVFFCEFLICFVSFLFVL